MKYLIFDKPSFNHLLFLSFFIIYSLRCIIEETCQPTEDIINNFHFSYILSLSDFLSIIPVIIIQKRSKSTKINESKAINETENSNEKELIFSDNDLENENKKSTTIFKLLIVISIFDFLAQYLVLIFFIIQQKSNIPIKDLNLNCVLIIHIIAQYLTNRIILHYLFYKHHYLSLIINIIFLIILGSLDIRDIYNSENKPIISLFFLLTNMLIIIFYSIEDALAKIVLTYNSISPYHYLLYRGIIVNCFVLIFSIIFIFVDIPDENGENSCVYTRFWKLYEDKVNIISYIGYLIIGFLFNVNIFLIIDKFTSSHFAASHIFGSFGYLLCSIAIFQNIDVSGFFLRFALYIILIIAASIHNEFIILKFCGFEKHTKLFLEKEAEKDVKHYDTLFATADTIIDDDIEDLIQKKTIELKNV